MANRSFTSLSQLESYIMKQVNTVLSTHVAPVVKESIQSSVSSVVYQAGIPEYYSRRGGNSVGGMGSANGSGSLGDVDQMHHTINNGILTVTDDAESSAPWWRRLDQAIEYGYGDWSGETPWYAESRPFMKDAREDLEQGKMHVEAMKDGLEEIFGVGNVIRG